MVFWLARWVLDLKVGGSTPSPCHRAVSLEKKLYHTGHARCINGDGLTSHPEESSNALSRFMLQKPVYDLARVGLWLLCDYFFVCSTCAN